METEKTYPCSFCSFVGITSKSLANHRRSHKEIQCDICQISLLNCSLPRHMKSKHEK